MNASDLTAIFFDQRHVVPLTAAAGEREAGVTGRPVDIVAGHLVMLFEAFCAGALRPFLEEDAEALVATRIEWLQRAPVTPGASLRLGGWVEAAGERSVTFRVQAHDAHEQVCEGRLRFDVDERARRAGPRAKARGHGARPTVLVGVARLRERGIGRHLDPAQAGEPAIE